MKISFKWYDIYCGVFIDTKKRKIYVVPFPMVVFEFKWKKKKMKTIRAEKCSTAYMSCHSKAPQQVIHEGYVKSWMGTGWVIEKKATATDPEKYPTVVRDDD
jgi:hypothetical protein